MRLKSKYQIEKAASEDATRFQIKKILIDDGKAVATDGRIMAIVPCVHADSEDKKTILADDLAFIRKSQKNIAKLSGEVVIELNGKIQASGDNGMNIELEAPDSNYPNYKQVIPQGEPKFRIGFDLQYLVKLAKAIGADGNEKGKSFVELELFEENGAFIVRNHKDKAAYGVQMPIKIL